MEINALQKKIAAFSILGGRGGCSSSKSANASDSAATPMSKPAANAELTERAADSLQSVGVPSAVADVGTHGEDLYDEAKAANWTKATVIMDSLDKSASQ